MKIAEGVSHRPNFINYTFREEMVSDGIENCLMYFENFDPKKSSNPFAYFSQFVHYAFIRRIEKEKKELYVKYKCTEEYGIFEDLNSMSQEDGVNGQFELYENISEFIEQFEKTKREKKKVRKPKGLEKLMED